MRTGPAGPGGPGGEPGAWGGRGWNPRLGRAHPPRGDVVALRRDVCPVCSEGERAPAVSVTLLPACPASLRKSLAVLWTGVPESVTNIPVLTRSRDKARRGVLH